MTQEHATVKSHVSGGDRRIEPAEALRLQFAEAWGDMSASWGVAPAIGRVHAYLMVRGREVVNGLKAAGISTGFGNEWIRIGGIKYGADGSAG